MKIEILGFGCPKRKQVEQNVLEALKQLNKHERLSM